MTQHKTVIERVAELEKAFPQLVEAINNQFNQRLGPVVQSINALIELLGRDTVVAKMTELKEKQQTQEMEAKKAQLDALVAEGRLVKAEVIKEGSVVVGRELNAEGKAIHPGRFQMTFNEIAPQFQEKLLGKGSNEKLDIPNYGSFEVQEVYEFVPVPVPAAIVETPTPN